MSVDMFINKIKSQDVWEQYEGWLWADDIGAKALPELGKMYSEDDQRLQRAAEESLDKIVHSVGADPNDSRRNDVIAELVKFTQSDSKDLKVYGIRALSYIGDEKVIQRIRPFLEDKDLREEAVFALERIPGEAPDITLVAALNEVDDDFKPRIIYALGRRKVENAVEQLANYFDHDNDEIAIRAFEAIANIGKKPDELNINANRFEGRHRTMFYDNWLRLADAQAKSGKNDAAIDMIDKVLTIKEEEIGEHMHCAAIISLGEIGNTKAKDLIKKAQANATSYIIKDTAEKMLNQA